MGIKFGTDGWRAVISEDFTFENLKTVAQATADYFKRQGRVTLAIGYDWRFLSEKYAELTAGVFAANGIKVNLSGGALPTPLVSLMIKKRRLAGGVVITASHNPPQYNGFKIKGPYASSADEDITTAVESRLGKGRVRSMPIQEAVKRGLVKIENFKPMYMAFVNSYIDRGVLKDSRLRVLVDCMHGVGDGYIKELLSGTKISITEIRTGRNPLFGGVSPEPIPKNLAPTFKEMKKGRYDIAVINDGDADRIGAITPRGRFLGAGQIMSLLLLHFIEDKGWRGSVVKTITNTSLIERITERYNLKLHETPVGFKHICRLMLEEDVLIGGEESGGIGVKGYIPERDGMLLGILLVEMISFRKKGIDLIMKEVERQYGSFFYQRIDMEYPDKKKRRLLRYLEKYAPERLFGKKIIEIKRYDGYKLIFEDRSWLILRLSGTEPILRIYAEAPRKNIAVRYLNFGKTLALSI